MNKEHLLSETRREMQKADLTRENRFIFAIDPSCGDDKPVEVVMLGDRILSVREIRNPLDDLQGFTPTGGKR